MNCYTVLIKYILTVSHYELIDRRSILIIYWNLWFVFLSWINKIHVGLSKCVVSCTKQSFKV